MSEFRQYLIKSVENIIAHGDTDIFPFPIENLLFKDFKNEVLNLLEKVHGDFYEYLNNYPVLHEKALQAVGYHGFRYGTQIDPLWNAYLLALVISIADDIEARRISVDKQKVFSYRYNYDEEKKYLFNRIYNWSKFNQRAVELAKQYSTVLKCDISNFYPSVYHHRIDNALRKATKNTESVKRILKLLSIISKGVSYGLPVGGPAARILSELLLNRVDLLLLSEGIEFCRYADDYVIFSNSVKEAYGNLIFLCEKLAENEGLAIQKSKTQIMTSNEFLALSEFGNANDSTDENKQADNFLKLRLFYDPYSPTADEDYDELKSELERFDIVGMLGKEITKSRINQALTRRLINSVKYLNVEQRKAAIFSLFGQRDESKTNLDLLYPVFPSVMLLCRAIISEIDDESKNLIFDDLKQLLKNNSYIIKVPINLMYAIRILAHDKSDEADFALTKVYKTQSNPIINAEIILALAQHDADFWISDKLKSFSSLSRWEKRSLLISSYILGDEGRHWRNKIQKELPEIDLLLNKWFSQRYKNNNGWGILL